MAMLCGWRTGHCQVESHVPQHHRNLGEPAGLSTGPEGDGGASDGTGGFGVGVESQRPPQGGSTLRE